MEDAEHRAQSEGYEEGGGSMMSEATYRYITLALAVATLIVTLVQVQ